MTVEVILLHSLLVKTTVVALVLIGARCSLISMPKKRRRAGCILLAFDI